MEDGNLQRLEAMGMVAPDGQLDDGARSSTRCIRESKDKKERKKKKPRQHIFTFLSSSSCSIRLPAARRRYATMTPPTSFPRPTYSHPGFSFRNLRLSVLLV